jgi:hypothetical protein
VSRIILRIAQIIGVLVLAGLAIGIVVGLVQWLIGVAVIVALVAGAWWLFKKVSGRDAKPAVGAPGPRAVTGGSGASGDRRTELEGRAVLDASGRCGWCGLTTLHKDEFGFPVTPLAFHRAEIDAML